MLHHKQVDFALYMRGSRRLAAIEHAGTSPPMFVGNLYPDVTLFLVRRDLHESGRLRTPGDLGKRPESGEPYRLAVGCPETGEHSIAQVVVNYFFGEQKETFQELRWDYEQVEAGFLTGELDAALITAGHQALIFKRLIQGGQGHGVIAEIPAVDAMVMKNIGLTSITIPAGLFRSAEGRFPQTPLTTISSRTIC